MKRFLLIITSLAIIAVGTICYIYYYQIPTDANKYISEKRERLLSEAKKQVDSLFVHKKKDIFTIYHDCVPRYVKGDALSQIGEMFKDIHETWTDGPFSIIFESSEFMGIPHNNGIKMPKDVVATYRVAPQNAKYDYRYGVVQELRKELRMSNSDNDGTGFPIHGEYRRGIWQTGWALGVRENWNSGIYGKAVVQYIIIPYAISFRETSYGSFEDFVSVDDALSNAYDFFVNNIESDFKRNMVDDVKQFIDTPQIENEYFTLKLDSTVTPFLSKMSSYADYSQYVYNNASYVFIRAYGKQVFELTILDDVVKKDKTQYIKKRTYRIFILGGGAIIVLIIIWSILLNTMLLDRRHKNQSLLLRVITKSNPQKHIKNYSADRLNFANDIYSKAISTNDSDMDGIIELAKRVESELGLHLYDKDDIVRLKKKCNPKRFLKPYDAERIAKANSLFDRLQNEKISLTDFLEIESEVISLENPVDPEITKEENNIQKENLMETSKNADAVNSRVQSDLADVCRE